MTGYTLIIAVLWLVMALALALTIMALAPVAWWQAAIMAVALQLVTLGVPNKRWR
jgi:hypothetical protein